MKYPRILLAGTNSGVGKTTLTVGLILALKRRGLKVQPFKAGPDYIDPSYHTFASRRICRNLDTWMLPEKAVLELFERQAKLSDISIVEGVMGLYDGIPYGEEGSSAHLAKILKSPVILVVDARSMSRSAAAVVLGYKGFDRDVDLMGVILNNIGSPSHYNSVKDAVEKKTNVPVLGFLPRDKNLALPQRHLGLIPADEKTPLGSFRRKLSNLVEKNIDIDRIIDISRKAQTFPRAEKRLFKSKPSRDKVTVAIAKDAAFNFYYQDNLDILSHNGADLIEFSPLRDKKLPRGADGLYIGGGFPELFASALSENAGLKNDIYERAKKGMPVYAECGGLMYLAGELVDFKNKRFPMVGIFDASVKMADRLRALGYVNIEVCKDNVLSNKGAKVRAHMFHWSYLDRFSRKGNFAYRVNKDKGKIFLDGLTRWNVLASYSHLHLGSNGGFAKNFIKNCNEYKRGK